ncbi:hypothetical protein V6N13_009723 [Hibiscus sabdariffa]
MNGDYKYTWTLASLIFSDINLLSLSNLDKRAEDRERGGKTEPADSYYEVRPECTDVPTTKFKIRPGKTLSVRKWQAAFSPDGQLDISKTLGRIHRGGIHPTIRGEVWEFLLCCFDPRSTYEEREQLRLERREQYEKLKAVCHEIFPVVGSGQFITAPVISEDAGAETPNSTEIVKDLLSKGPLDKRIVDWLLLLHQIGLDVKRTDRSLVFYEKQENLLKLWDILAVYAWIDTDVGYCQGMSDLCSPMIILLEHEADAFWCFERLMRRLVRVSPYTDVGHQNFKKYEELKQQTITFCQFSHVWFAETLGGGDYLFAVRMLMVLFRREFSFCDSLYLWEMMWALEYDPDLFYLYEEPSMEESSKLKSRSMRNYGKFERENMKMKTEETPLPISVFLVASVLKDKSTQLLHEARGLDDVVKILNDITGSLDAKKACNEAIRLHKKYLKKASQQGKTT